MTKKKIGLFTVPSKDPTDQSEIDKNMFRINRKLKDRVPFAVIGSNCVLQINEKRIRARQYPWGIAEVENSDHCDFKILRDMLIRTHMQVRFTVRNRPPQEVDVLAIPRSDRSRPRKSEERDFTKF